MKLHLAALSDCFARQTTCRVKALALSAAEDRTEGDSRHRRAKNCTDCQDITLNLHRPIDELGYWLYNQSCHRWYEDTTITRSRAARSGRFFQRQSGQPNLSSYHREASRTLRLFFVSRLAMDWTGLTASSATIARSGTGGIGAAIPRRPVAKIALAFRTAVGCRRPHWVFIEGAPFAWDRLGASEPLGYLS
jgi:hypothetical protein